MVGYHYLSTPVYKSIKEQLTEYDVFYFFPKDTIASDTNFKYFDRDVFKSRDKNYIELEYDPPWFRGIMTWHLRYKLHKLWMWIVWIWSFGKFKDEIDKVISKINPDILLITSDLFFTPRHISVSNPKIPIVLIQPCYLDLWEREYRYGLIKKFINYIQPHVFEQQQYFGMEIKRSVLLVWEKDAYEKYKKMGRDVRKIINPTHLSIINNADFMRGKSAVALKKYFKISNNKPIITIFTARYTEIHGIEYQQHLERSLIKVILNLDNRCNIIVKIHPNEDLQYWMPVLSDVLNSIQIIQNTDRFALLALSDIMISTNSYSSLEATLSKCVSVNFVPGISQIGEDFCKSFDVNSVVVIRSVDEMIKFVEDYDTEYKFSKFANKISELINMILGYNQNHEYVGNIFKEILNPSND